MITGLVAHLCCFNSLLQVEAHMRGVARTWAIMFYATSVISVEVMR